MTPRGRVYRMQYDVTPMGSAEPVYIAGVWHYVITDDGEQDDRLAEMIGSLLRDGRLVLPDRRLVVARGGGYPSQPAAFTACCAAFRSWWSR